MEILFRGQRKHTDEWVFGSFVHKWRHEGNIIENCISVDGMMFQVKRETVGQFTGRVIKTNPKIKVFVGDKVLVMGTKKIGLYETEVIFSGFSFTLKENKTRLTDSNCLLAVMNVIGSIHKHTEILK